MNIDTPLPDDDPLPDWQKRWDVLDTRLKLMFKLIYDFHEQYDGKTVNGEKGKPGRKDLQLQLTLYRQECVRIHNEFIALNIEKLRWQRKAQP